MSYQSEVAQLASLISVTACGELVEPQRCALRQAQGAINFCHWLGNWLVLAILSLLGVVPLPTHADLSADLAAAVDAPYLTFTTAGNAPWYVDTTTS